MAQELTIRSKFRVGKAVKAVSICLISVLALWLLTVSFLALEFGGNPLDSNPFDDSTFNRAQWSADQNRSDGSSRRGHMAQDIIYHHLKNGMSEQDVIALLGSPKIYSASEFQSYYGRRRFYLTALRSSNDNQHDEVLRYGLGEELDMAWGIDHADLYVYFRNGHYIGSRIGWPG